MGSRGRGHYQETAEEVALCLGCPLAVCVEPGVRDDWTIPPRRRRCPWSDAGYRKREEQRLKSFGWREMHPPTEAQRERARERERERVRRWIG